LIETPNVPQREKTRKILKLEGKCRSTDPMDERMTVVYVDKNTKYQRRKRGNDFCLAEGRNREEEGGLSLGGQNRKTGGRRTGSIKKRRRKFRGV